MAALDGTDRALATLSAAARTAAPDSLRAAFVRARLAYKAAEPLVELYAPTTADGINGPALDEVEEDDPNRFVMAPEGFQVMEELLWPEWDDASRAGLAEETEILRANLRRARGMLAATPVSDAAVWDAARQQIARVVVLGLAGFDSPIAGQSLPEAAAALRGLRAATDPWSAELRRRDPALAGDLAARFAAAIAAVDTAKDADAFDRLAFLTDRADPLARTLWRARERLGIAAPPDRRAWRGEAATLWAPGALDALAFAPNDGGGAAAGARAELGRLLFFDPVLSGGGGRACASCHVPERAFTDGRARPAPLHAGGAVPARNTPTVINAGLQAGTFYDLRTAYLEDQVTDVVQNRDEMHGDFARAAALLRGSGDYRARFARAFPGGGTDVEWQIRAAVAAYVRSLEGLSSPFDRYLAGDRGALGAEEKRGFNLFMGRARCGTCHFAPLFSGTVPPAFSKAEAEVLGVPDRPGRAGARVDADEGKGALQSIPLYRHAFKTPTVRNVALTAPYMHNGVFRTLEEVVDFYDGGGGPAWGVRLENQTLPTDSLHLTARDRADLVAFLRALTDTVHLTARPARLPDLPGLPDRRPPAAYP